MICFRDFLPYFAVAAPAGPAPMIATRLIPNPDFADTMTCEKWEKLVISSSENKFKME